MALCVLLCGVLTRPGGVVVGWVLQVGPGGLAAAVVPLMFFLGVVFAGLWWAAVHYGREIDVIKARRAQLAGQAPAAGPSGD